MSTSPGEPGRRPDDLATALLAAGNIVLDGLDDDPQERWGFRDITPDSALWTGEVSEDNRQTWRLDERMYLRRRK